MWLILSWLLKNADAFDVIGLREQVKWRDLNQPVAIGDQSRSVPRQGGGITRDVSDCLRVQG